MPWNAAINRGTLFSTYRQVHVCVKMFAKGRQTKILDFLGAAAFESHPRPAPDHYQPRVPPSP